MRLTGAFHFSSPLAYPMITQYPFSSTTVNGWAAQILA
jgi:hypothetical protein